MLNVFELDTRQIPETTLFDFELQMLGLSVAIETLDCMRKKNFRFFKR